MKITYLIPIAGWQKTSKIFTAPKEMQSSYNLGSQFTYEQAEYTSLSEFAFDLQSRDNCISISGKPTDLAEFDVLTEGSTKRRTVNFKYPDDQTLHVFDIDGWTISEAARKSVGAELTDPESMGRLIDQLLRTEGFDFLAEASKVIVLTSSQWCLTKLNCHIYFNFDTPIRLESMREYGTALAKINQRTVFDPACWRAVQPIFHTPPVCTGFIDPLKGKRIWYQKGSVETIPLLDLKAEIEKTLGSADWDPNNTKNDLPSIGTSWLDTIRKHCGDERGVNEPSFRAAAQLVQEMGRSNVLTNINVYAKQMYDEVWKTLITSGADRGQSAKDKQTYDLARFRQYLESATSKNFGDGVDIMVAQVNEAIKKAVAGDTMALISSPVIHSLCTLRSKHKAQFIAIKTSIKKSKTVSLTDITELMRGGASSVDSSGPDDGNDFIFAADDGARAENELIDTVLGKYNMVADTFGNKFASVPGNGDGGYRMMRVDGSLVDVFYCDGLEMSGNQVGPNFGRKAISKLMGMEARSIHSIFEENLVGTRVLSEDQTMGSPTWVNLGLQTDGMFKAVKIKADGMEIMSHRDSHVKWMFGVPALHIATNEDIVKRFGDEDIDLTDYIMETLPKFINTDSHDLPKLLMWLCSVYSDKSLNYILELTGPAAAGKSTAADMMKDLTDPSGNVMGTGGDRTIFTQHTENNLIADIERRHVTILDNISKLTTKSQDLLCSIATGLRHGERILYTQSQMERTVRRPLIITALGQVITRDDLKTRVVSVEVEEAEYNRTFIESWTEEKPFLVAAVMQLTSKAMALAQKVTQKPKGVGTRDIFLACVTSAIMGETEVDFRYVIEERMSEAVDRSEDVGFVMMLSRWMDDVGEGQEEVCFTTRGLVGTLREWVLVNSGIKVSGVTMRHDMVPNTGRGLGWNLARYTDTISKVSSWEFIRKERRTNGVKYTWRRKTVDVEDLY